VRDQQHSTATSPLSLCRPPPTTTNPLFQLKGRLARFIGVFSTPANEDESSHAPTAISMTAPVLLSNPAPRSNEDKASHATRERVMMFTMPASRFKSVDMVPKPKDARVTIKELPSQVTTFVGFASVLAVLLVDVVSPSAPYHQPP
jgi:hypothetical protein